MSDRIPSEAIADPIDSAVGHPTSHAFLGAGAARCQARPSYSAVLLRRQETALVRPGNRLRGSAEPRRPRKIRNLTAPLLWEWWRDRRRFRSIFRKFSESTVVGS